MFGSAWGVWQTHAHDDIDVDDDEDNHDHHYHNHLSVSLVGRRVSSAHVPADDYRFIDRGGTIFVQLSLWGNRNRVAMGQLSQGSGLSGNVVHVTAALFETLRSESSFGNVYSHMRRDPRDS